MVELWVQEVDLVRWGFAELRQPQGMFGVPCTVVRPPILALSTLHHLAPGRFTFSLPFLAT